MLIVLNLVQGRVGKIVHVMWSYLTKQSMVGLLLIFWLSKCVVFWHFLNQNLSNSLTCVALCDDSVWHFTCLFDTETSSPTERAESPVRPVAIATETVASSSAADESSPMVERRSQGHGSSSSTSFERTKSGGHRSIDDLSR